MVYSTNLNIFQCYLFIRRTNSSEAIGCGKRFIRWSDCEPGTKKRRVQVKFEKKILLISIETKSTSRASLNLCIYFALVNHGILYVIKISGRNQKLHSLEKT
jgi:hypothetical protein